MSRTSDFSKIKGVARIGWEMRTETPLCIKAGTTSVFQRKMDFDFFKQDKENETDALISDFYYDAYIREDRLDIRYRIPASSVRGALRNYTIRRLIPKLYQDADILPVAQEDENDDAWAQTQNAYCMRLKNALQTPGWHLIQNLFGMAAETETEILADETVAGRLRVMVGDLKELSSDEFRKNFVAGRLRECHPGSTHGKMIVSTRNPLDRATRSSKGGGLHSFMELAPNNAFSVTLSFLNPGPQDLGLVAFWEQAVNEGFLRFGGLTSSGRGRLRITSADVRLFLREVKDFPEFERCDDSEVDILADILPEHRISDWDSAKEYYLEVLDGKYKEWEGKANE